MNPDYSNWSKRRLIDEIKMLREGLHLACNEGNGLMIRNVRLAAAVQSLRLRLSCIERTREVFHGH